MPRGDRTGPEGEGPLTGRQAGYCAGNDRPGFAEPGPGYAGRGRGFYGRRGGGGGRGFRRAPRGGGPNGYRWRNWFYATGVPGWARFGPDVGEPVGETETLQARADWLRGELDAIDKRLQELDQND